MRRPLAPLLAPAIAVMAVLALSPLASAGGSVAITSVAPARGTTAGGTTVTVRGSGLCGAGLPVIRFDGVEATETRLVQFCSEYQAVTPPQAAGAVAVDVYEAARVPPVIATLAGGFTYEAPALNPVPTPATPAADTGAYRTLTVRNLAGPMPRGDAQYGATQGDTGAFTTLPAPNGTTAVTSSGYTGGIFCGTWSGAYGIPLPRPSGWPAAAPWLSTWVRATATGDSCSWTYPQGARATLQARPSMSLLISGLQFFVPIIPEALGWVSGWGGACKGNAGTTCTVTMDQDRTVNVAFGGSGINVGYTGKQGEALMNSSTADPDTGEIRTIGLLWRNTTGSSPSPSGSVLFRVEVTNGIAAGRAQAEAAPPARGRVACRQRTALVDWRARATCPVGPTLARALARGPVRAVATASLRLRGRDDWVQVARRPIVLRNGIGTRVTG